MTEDEDEEELTINSFYTFSASILPGNIKLWSGSTW